MLNLEKQNEIRKQILDFSESMLLKRNVGANRTWRFSLERFVDFINDKGLDFDVGAVNEYIGYLEGKEMGRSDIQRVVEVIFSFGEFVNIPLDKGRVNFKFADKLDPVTVLEEDIIRTEKVLYEAVVTGEEGDFGKKRDTMRNYLMFRLILETGMDTLELIRLDTDSLQDNGLLMIHDREVPLSQGLQDLIREYISFRKKYDESLFMDQVAFEVNSLKGSNDLQQDRELEQFYRLALPEKLEKIELLLGEQMRLEEEVLQLEMLDDGENDEKIAELEDEIDSIVERINERKSVLVLERKTGEYEFNPAMFVMEGYHRLVEDVVEEILKMEAFPVQLLQYSAAEKWEKAGIKPNLINQFLGNKGSIFGGTASIADFKQIIEAGFSFTKRSFQ
ncbi:site-specific recombinase XerD [Evansella vedderi]|uniref:Site-specific recombinase XerD n=1 Tax=Evansella vedderi TaxID=38282 RepID=A0ABT9ZW32_9BACI|nr:hypothetical protein [Evansella vedderi]MDQ0254693.1 site-specific recombinase XerD [Evansella vedderi]